MSVGSHQAGRSLDTLLYAEAGEAERVARLQLASGSGPISELGLRLRELDPPVVVTCARGSSDHAATYAKYLIETRLGLPTASHAPSVTSVYGSAFRRLRNALFLAISQSGRSPDLVLSAKEAKAAGAFVVTCTNDADSPLARTADAVVPLMAGPERSVAATKSYIASLLAVLQLTAAWTEATDLSEAARAAPHALAEAWILDWSEAVASLVNALGMFVIGRGLGLGVAQEAALKLKETCGLHAEAFSAAEVRHGPMALVGPGYPVMMMATEDAVRSDFELLSRDFLQRGATVIAAGFACPGAIILPVVEGLHPAVAPLALVQSFYRFVNELSLARGHDPDRPPHLRKVTETR